MRSNAQRVKAAVCVADAAPDEPTLRIPTESARPPAPPDRLIDQPDTIGNRVLVRRAGLRDMPSIIGTTAELLRRADLDRAILEDGGDPAEATCLLNEREVDALLGLIEAGARLLHREIAACVGESDEEPGIPGFEVQS